MVRGREEMSAHYTTPKVLHGVLKITHANNKQLEPIIVGSDRWFSWLQTAQSFNYLGEVGQFTARKEKRRNTQYWYGCKKIGGKVVSETKTSTNNHPGRIIKIEVAQPELEVQAKMVLVGTRLYQVLTVSKKGQNNTETVKKFLDSFKLKKK